MEDFRSMKDLGNVVLKEVYQTRVYTEMQELDIKTNNLDVFIKENPTYQELDVEEKRRLSKQLVLMKSYLTILIKRIENFG